MCHCSSRALVPSSTHRIGSLDKSCSLKGMGAQGVKYAAAHIPSDLSKSNSICCKCSGEVQHIEHLGDPGSCLGAGRVR